MTLTPVVTFHAHVDLLRMFLGHRQEVVEAIDRLLNCQKKPLAFQQDFLLLSRLFKECFFTLGGLGPDQVNLRDQLEHAHWASEFKPRAQAGNDLVDPVEQMLRGFHLWRQTHWPGQKGRLRFAHTLFNLYVLRCLALLCMRLWDEEDGGVATRLAQAQAVLDALWRSSPADQPRLVRDVRWLFSVAMSPTTDSLAGYFHVAERIAETFAEADRLETFKAWVLTGAGHLRSQLRDLAVRRSVPVDDNNLVLLTRVSNALDIALMLQGLVPLLEAYAHSRRLGDALQRMELASAICQGLSPDPDLFVNRLDLLGPYSMIEYLFITLDSAGHAEYTAMGQRHVALLEKYAVLLGELAQPLYEDCRQSRQAHSAYTPYGALYGFASNLIELMAFKTLQRDAVTQFSMEDAFTDGTEDKLVWVNAWRKLPHIKPEVVKQFEFPRQFADEMHARIEQALQKRVSGAAKLAAMGHLFISADASGTNSRLAQIADLPLHYIVSSDPQPVAAHKAEAKDQDDLLHCRMEGEFLVSYQTPGGWLAISKDMLTEVLGAGRDVQLTGLPGVATEVLKLMCPNLVVLPK